GFTFFIRRVVEGKVEKVPYDAGVIVEVTPQVTNSGEIVLKVHTEVSDILERNPVDGDVDKLSKQVSETILRVKDGQTVVIGGLIKNSTKYSKQGVPLLSDIPLIGALFSQTSDEREDNELIIVLKARRVTPTQCPPRLETPCP
ncbi:MAG TPA: type II and III secretion system protein, partial [Oceanithermus sp.]|nr:type II and III secretion system protein [Oceanithermus sp.]